MKDLDRWQVYGIVAVVSFIALVLVSQALFGSVGSLSVMFLAFTFATIFFTIVAISDWHDRGRW